jgi:hypothetical protein
MQSTGEPDEDLQQDDRASFHFISGGLGQARQFLGQTLQTFGPPHFWPYASFKAFAEVVINSWSSVYRGQNIRYGDGKPVLLVPGHLAGDTTLLPLSLWLRGIGYRPARCDIVINMNDQSLDEPLAAALRSAVCRVGRKGVIIAFDTGVRAALRVAAIDQDYISDVIALAPSDRLPDSPAGVRLHVVETSRRSAIPQHPAMHVVDGSNHLLPVNPAALRILSELLREIPITLLDGSS